MITRAQLREHDLSDDQVDQLIGSRAVTQIWPALFLARGAPFSYEAQLWAAALSFRGVLGFATAAHLWAWRRVPNGST